MKIQLNKPQLMLFALLRASLHEKEVEVSCFQGATDDDWKRCYQLAVAQGVMALAWDGVLRLPIELMPFRNLKLTWAMAVEKYEAKYRRYCRTVDELSTFYANHGIATVQLKGVGFSTYYPVPEHREGGDIDIYTYSADKNKMSDAEANGLADTLIEQQGIEVEYHSYKHSNFYYKGIPIENHKSFLNVNDYEEAVLANELLKRNLDPQEVVLAEGRVLIPSSIFNSLFIAFHAMQHYGSGLALHHLCDWAMILKNVGWNLPTELNSQPFIQGVAALTHLCNQYLGTSVSVKGGEKIAKVMLDEILVPKFVYNSDIPAPNKLGIIIYKIRRFKHRIKLKKSVFGLSFGKQVWDSIVSHIRNPKTIFGS